MNIRNLAQLLDEEFRIGQAEDFDNVGLLIGNPEENVKGILVAHDATLEVIGEAASHGLNFILLFHPIIFSGLKKLTGADYVQKIVTAAIESKIALYAVHTAFDNDRFGVSGGMAQTLGLENQRVLAPKKDSLLSLQFYVPAAAAEEVKQGIFSVGGGYVGNYDQCSFTLAGEGSFRPLPGANPAVGSVGELEFGPELQVSILVPADLQRKAVQAMKAAHPYEEVAYSLVPLKNENQYSGLGIVGELSKELSVAEFLSLIKEKFQASVIRHSKFSGNIIKRVGVLGGSGAEYIKTAISAGCDAYVTADLKYHDFFQPEGKMLLCDIGHYESECRVVPQLIQRFSEKFPNFAVRESGIKTNPVHYFF